MDRSRLHKKTGFTLVELMIALTVLTMALGVIIPFIIFTFKGAILNESSNALFARTRYVYDRMQHDAAQSQYAFGLYVNGDKVTLDRHDTRVIGETTTDIVAFVSTAMGFDRSAASILDSTPVPMADCIYKIVFYYFVPLSGSPGYYQLYRAERSVDPSTLTSDSGGLPVEYSLSSLQSGAALLLDKVSKVYTGSADTGFCCSIVRGKTVGISCIAYYNIWDLSGNRKPLIEANMIMQTVLGPL